MCAAGASSRDDYLIGIRADFRHIDPLFAGQPQASALAYGVMGDAFVSAQHFYARIARLPNGRYSIRRGVSEKKDQTYALYSLTQEQLAHTLMPVGEYEKAEVRAIASRLGLPVAQKPDSQEICFVPDDDYAGFIDGQAPGRVPGPGDFVDAEGKVLLA